ncbi:hypothetical protein CHUAL_008005 [Chamberlinius hualienensis]
MRRSIFDRSRVGPKEEPVNNSSHPGWQNPPPNSLAGIKFYNPNSMAQQNHHHNHNPYVGQQQNAWPNGVSDQGAVPLYQADKPLQAPFYQADKPLPDETYNYSQGSTDTTQQSHAGTWNWGNSNAAPMEQHNNWSSTYPVVQETSNVANPDYSQQPTVGSAAYSNFNDAWNWRVDDENGHHNRDSTAKGPSETGNSSSENQVDILAQNLDDQANENYQRWNLAQHFQYDWSQSQQVEGATLPSALGQDSQIQWSPTLQTDSSAPWTRESCPNLEENTSNLLKNVLPNAVNDVYAEDSVSEQLSKGECGGNGVGSIEDQGSVSAYFRHGGDDDVEIKEINRHEGSADKIEDEVTGESVAVHKPVSELNADMQVNQHWQPYLRVDSWMSNSSLVTYNRSFTGSQEYLLSGSLYGGEDGAPGIMHRSSLGGITQGVDEMHISTSQLSRQCDKLHPLHTSYSGRDDDNDDQRCPLSTTSEEKKVLEESESKALIDAYVIANADQSSSVQNDDNLEIVPICNSLDISNNSIQMTDQPELEVENLQLNANADDLNNGCNQDNVTNEEVPSSGANDTSKSLPESEAHQQDSVEKSVAENVEVVDKRRSIPDVKASAVETSQGLVGWSRENSAFQAPLVTVTRLAVSDPVIQREILDDVPGVDSVSKSVATVIEDSNTANLEMVPDNSERPPDFDVNLTNKSDDAPRDTRLTAPTSTVRHRAIDHKIPSPGTTLWDSPELSGNIGSVLAPPAIGTNMKGPTQNVLVVPKLVASPENTTNSNTAATSLVQPVAQWSSQITENSLQRQTAVGGANDGPSVTTTAASPLDLSSRAAPQGRSFIDDEAQRHSRLEPDNGNRDLSDQLQPNQNASSSSTRGGQEADGRPNLTSYSGSNLESDNNRQWRQSSRSDYLRDNERDWDDRHRPNRAYDDDYNRRDASRRDERNLPPDSRDLYGGGSRRDERGLPPDARDTYGGGPRRDERGLAPDTRDAFGVGPRRDERGLPPDTRDAFGVGPRRDERGLPPDTRDAYGVGPRRDERGFANDSRDLYGGTPRRDERGPPPDLRDPYGRSQPRRDTREWERDSANQMSDPYYRSSYQRPERERSRPSSRASNHEYESDRYYDRRDPYAGPDDGRGHLQRPTSRSGYESDHGSDRQRYQPPYDPYYQREPQYPGYQDYTRYPQNPYADMRHYYGMSNYDYGYYAELYGNDPRYRAYYESLAKGYYWQQQPPYPSRYEDYDRQSVHSGRSSVTDDSRNSQTRRESKDYSTDLGNTNVSASLNLTTQDHSGLSFNDSYLSQTSLHELTDQISAGMDILSKQRLTPAKFLIPHVRATFCPSGKLAIVLPNSIADGQPASVEICEGLCSFGDDEVTKQFSDFPGPLIRGDTHKNDVIQFCTQKIKKAKTDVNLPDRESCILIWELLVLLVRQNGVVVGTDIAELLLKDRCLSEPELATSNINNGQEVDGTILAETSDNPVALLSQESQDANKFLEFLLYGHKKDALEWAMKRGIWGHALFLASKMDTRTYAMVMTRFANSLKFNHPLQTLYQLMSGRQPAAVTNVADEKWGDWRPHLAVILSNTTQRPELDRKSVVTLGDTLAAKGCLHAAHFCYLMAQLEFGNYAKKSSKLVLIGSNHSLPFSQFATEEAIQCTEIYEYVQSLANPEFVLPHIQFYKFLYATRLVDSGCPQKALHYCEIVASSIRKWPHLFDTELARQVYELAYRLKYYDPHYLQEEGEVADIGDPTWLKELLNVIQSYNSGVISTPVSEDLDQKLGSGSPESSATTDTYGIDTSTSSALDATTYNNQNNISYGQAVNSIGTVGQGAYEDYNQYSNTPKLPPDLNYAHQEVDYSYQNTGSTVQQPNDYQSATSNYNYDSYFNTPSSNFNNHLHSETAEARTDPEMDYYGASTHSNTISSVSASTSSKAQEHRQIRRTSSGAPALPVPSKDLLAANKAKQSSSKSAEKERPKQGGSWLGGIFSKFYMRPKNQMILPDDKNPKIVWDPKISRWTNTEGGEEEEPENPALAAPPKDLEVQEKAGGLAAPLSGNFQPNQLVSNTTASQPPTIDSGVNRYKLRPGRGMRNNYVDVLGGNVVPVQSTLDTKLTDSTATPSYPVQYFVPLPVAGSENAPVDFISTTNTVPSSNDVADSNPEQPTGANSNPSILEQSDNINQPMMMYNPNMIPTSNNAPNVSSGLLRYGRRPR